MPTIVKVGRDEVTAHPAQSANLGSTQVAEVYAHVPNPAMPYRGQVAGRYDKIRVGEGIDVAPIAPNRRELEALWWGRVQQARARYKRTLEALQYVKLEYADDIPSPDGHFALQRAQRIELSALREYQLTLKIYADLLTQGKTPPVDV